MHYEDAFRQAVTRSDIWFVEDVAGRWTDNNGSVLELAVDGYELNGALTMFGVQGEPIRTQVRGYAMGDLVSFAVFDDRSGIVSAWTGELKGSDADILKVHWRLLNAVTRRSDDDTYRIETHIGTAEFRRSDKG